MHAEVENKRWSTYVHDGNDFRLQSSVAVRFPNDHNETLTIGLPNIEHVKAVSKKDLPPIMWRVYSRTSAGDNSEAGFNAHAQCEMVANKYGLQAGSRSCRIEDIEQADMRDMLSNHLGWKKKNGGFESRFISITSSLLFALQLAVQKHTRMKREHRMEKEPAKRMMKEANKLEANQTEGGEEAELEIARKNSRVNVPEAEIYISIIDTSKLLRGTTLYKANALVAAYQNGKALTQNREFFIAEYLAWETLNLDSCHVSFDTLLEKGFFPLFDDFKESPNTLQTQIQRLRKELYDWGPLQDKKRTAFSHKKFGIAMRLAASFDKKWQLSMFVGFLSISRRWYTDDSILERALQAINGKTSS
jgi:hypothetical protein